MLTKVKPKLKRLSVDAGLHPQGLLSSKIKQRQSMGVSPQLYRQLPPIPSKSNLSQDDNYQIQMTKKASQTDTRQQIKAVFQKLSTKESVVTLDIIENCLIQLGEDPKHAVDMLQLLDVDNLGYIEEEMFVDYFLRRPIESELDYVPESMIKRSDIVRFISQKNKGLKALEDPEFCEKVMKQFCNKMDSKSQINSQN